MNRIFTFLIAAAFAAAAFQQLTWAPPVDALPGGPPTVAPMQALSDAILASAATAVELILKLIGATAFFLGVMKVAEEGGALTLIARLIRPLMVRLFPEVPSNHPAMAAMILNLSANALGLGNAATPLGLKAMAELDKLNRYKGTASNAMVLFLAINTSSVTLLPTGVIVLRESLGSTMGADILPTTLMATLLSTTTAILAATLGTRWAATAADLTPKEDVVDLPDGPHEVEEQDAFPAWASWLALTALIAAIPLSVVYGKVIAPWIVPTLTVTLLGFGWWRGVPVYEAFTRGAREAWDLSARIIPFLVATLSAVGMFRASGAMDALVAAIDPITRPLGLPGAALPMALIRPLSGSGAYGVLTDTLKNPATGPDTYTGFLVSTINGSSETTFYVLAVYFGSVGVRRYRHAIAAGLLADVAGVVGSILAVRLYFAWMGMPVD